MNREQKLIRNWTDSSNDYSNSVKEELNSFKKQAWTNMILDHSEKRTGMAVLDVGTGPGFFAIILSQAGNKVTAIDCTTAMIEEAKANAKDEGVTVDFRVADGQNLEFEDQCFDLIVSRNVAWTLIDAERAYGEWQRVLKPSGKIMIFDSNWNIRLFNEDYLKRYEEDQQEYERLFGEKPPQYTAEMIEYRKSMPMCQRIRPQWDFDALVRLGFKKIYCETSIGDRVYDEKQKVRYHSSPLFMLVVEK